jgi:hypothetical protein
MKETQMYCAVATNMVGAGAPMGMQETPTMWRKFFKKFREAKLYCEKHYGRGKRKRIDWHTDDDGVSSGDLSWVMYDIFKVKTED